VLVEDAVITSITDFQQQLANFRTGQRLSLTINRDEELKTVELRIP
jgi:S1-C subfamily serine protease